MQIIDLQSVLVEELDDSDRLPLLGLHVGLQLVRHFRLLQNLTRPVQLAALDPQNVSGRKGHLASGSPG